ncbi:MAG: hypothetical protein H6914_09720 [Novosphingobium sp.]|nr:hypothetical protein [Novosphingobium sp.]
MLIGDLSIQLYRYRRTPSAPSPSRWRAMDPCAIAPGCWRFARHRLRCADALLLGIQAMIPLFNSTAGTPPSSRSTALFFQQGAHRKCSSRCSLFRGHRLLAFFYRLWILLLYPGVIFMAWYGTDRDIRHRSSSATSSPGHSSAAWSPPSFTSVMRAVLSGTDHEH